MSGRVITALVAAALLLSACAEREQTMAGGTSSTQQSALAPVVNDVLARLDQGSFGSIELGPAPGPDFRQGAWLDVVVNGHGPQNHDQLLGLWEADLAEGAIQELGANSDTKSLADVVAGESIAIRNGDGTLTDLGADAAGDQTPGRKFQPPPDAVAISSANQAVQAVGMTPLSVRVLHPVQSALYVTAEVANVYAVEKFAQLLSALRGGGAVYEGIYLEVRDKAGQTLVAVAASPRTGTGRLWIKPGLPADPGIPHGSLGMSH